MLVDLSGRWTRSDDKGTQLSMLSDLEPSKLLKAWDQLGARKKRGRQ
jgi:hypothetical protein